MSKERLTNETLNNAIATYKTVVESVGDIFDEDYSPILDKVTLSFLEELKQYRELEEQGLLLRLPVAVGCSIWDNDFGSPYRYEVTGFSYGDINEDDYDYDEELPTDELIVHYRNHNGSITGKFPISEIGKTVFLTQAEAEEKLRELEGK